MFSDRIRIAAVLILLSHFAHTYVLLTANIEDVKRLAKKFVSAPLANKIADLIFMASNNNAKMKMPSVSHFLEENNEKEQVLDVSDVEQQREDTSSKRFKTLHRDPKQPRAEPTVNIEAMKYPVQEETRKPAPTQRVRKEPPQTFPQVYWHQVGNPKRERQHEQSFLPNAPIQRPKGSKFRQRASSKVRDPISGHHSHPGQILHNPAHLKTQSHVHTNGNYQNDSKTNFLDDIIWKPDSNSDPSLKKKKKTVEEVYKPAVLKPREGEFNKPAVLKLREGEVYKPTVSYPRDVELYKPTVLKLRDNEGYKPAVLQPLEEPSNKHDDLQSGQLYSAGGKPKDRFDKKLYQMQNIIPVKPREPPIEPLRLTEITTDIPINKKKRIIRPKQQKFKIKNRDRFRNPSIVGTNPVKSQPNLSNYDVNPGKYEAKPIKLESKPVTYQETPAKYQANPVKYEAKPINYEPKPAKYEPNADKIDLNPDKTPAVSNAKPPPDTDEPKNMNPGAILLQPRAENDAELDRHDKLHRNTTIGRVALMLADPKDLWWEKPLPSPARVNN